MRFSSVGSVTVLFFTVLTAALVTLSAGSAFALSANHGGAASTSPAGGEIGLSMGHVGPKSGYVPPSVGQTTVLINNTVYPGLYRSVDTLDSGRFPEAWGTTPAYDPSTNLFYEPVQNITENSTSLYYGGFLAAISPATGTLVSLVPVGLIPEGVAFDSSNGLLYVVNHDMNYISVVDPITNTVVGSLGLPSGSGADGSAAVNNSSGHLFLASPFGVVDVNISNDLNVSISNYGALDLVYDNQTGEVYVVGSGISGYPYVSIIGPNNDTVWRTITLPGASGVNPGVPAVDWKTDELYVPCGNNVSTVDLATGILGPTLSLTTALLASPAAAFDPDNGGVYVVSEGYSGYNVTELDSATHTWVANSTQIPSGGYGGITYSSVSHRLLIAGEWQSGSTGFVLMSPTLQILGYPVSTVTPSAQSYFDPLTGNLFVPLPGGGTYGNVSVIDPRTGHIIGYVPAGTSPTAVWVDPNTGFGYIANFGPPPTNHVDNLTVFNAHTLADTGSIPVGVRPFTLTYDPNNGYLYVGNGGTGGNGNVTVINPATNTTVTSINLPGLTPGAAMYDPTTSDLYFVGSVGRGVLRSNLHGCGEYPCERSRPLRPTVWSCVRRIYWGDLHRRHQRSQLRAPRVRSGFAISPREQHQPLSHQPLPDVGSGQRPPLCSGRGQPYRRLGREHRHGGQRELRSPRQPDRGGPPERDLGQCLLGGGLRFQRVLRVGHVHRPGTPSSSSTYNVTFDTVPTSCSVTFNGVSYTNGQEATGVTGGSYSLAANSCSGETFSSWSSTAGTVTSLTSASTSILVSSNGTVTGTYTTTPIGYTVTFDTMPTSCSVTFNGVSYSNGQQATGVTGGSYPLVANACSGETFSSWTSSAGTVTSLTAASTSIAVSASGTVTGTFTATSTSYTIAFDVVPSTCSLTFNGNPYSNGGQATGVAAGAYSLDAAACAGETFTSWSSTVGTVASLTSSSTMVTVSSSGTITATFAPTPPATYPVTFVETGLPSGYSHGRSPWPGLRTPSPLRPSALPKRTGPTCSRWERSRATPRM